jgi:general stress protein 26
MLVTRTADGGMRARPLSIAESQDDGAMYFSTSIDSPEVEELETDCHVNVVMQDGRRFVMVAIAEDADGGDWLVRLGQRMYQIAMSSGRPIAGG